MLFKSKLKTQLLAFPHAWVISCLIIIFAWVFCFKFFTASHSVSVLVYACSLLTLISGCRLPHPCVRSPFPNSFLTLKDSSASSPEGDDDGDSADSDSSSEVPGAETCAICLGRMRGEVGSPESCDHTFCLMCILEWAKVCCFT